MAFVHISLDLDLEAVQTLDHCLVVLLHCASKPGTKQRNLRSEIIARRMQKSHVVQLPPGATACARELFFASFLVCTNKSFG